MAGVNSDTSFTSKETNPKKEKPAWFTEDVREIPSNARNLLEKYSHIAPDQVLPYVVEQVRSYDLFVYLTSALKQLTWTNFLAIDSKTKRLRYSRIHVSDSFASSA